MFFVLHSLLLALTYVFASLLCRALERDNVFLLSGTIVYLSLLFVLLYVPETKGLNLGKLKPRYCNKGGVKLVEKESN